MIVLASLQETASGIVEQFGIDVPMLIAQGINFIIVAYVIYRFALNARCHQIALCVMTYHHITIRDQSA